MVPAFPPQALIPPHCNPAQRPSTLRQHYPGPATLTISRYPSQPGILWVILWARMCGVQPGRRPWWNQPAGRATGDRPQGPVVTGSRGIQPSADSVNHLGTACQRPRSARTRKDATPMNDDPSVTDLVTRATNGDQGAWGALVDRYAPLIWSICREHSLSDADAHDIGQAIWLQLVNQLSNVRDPAAFAGWLATTTRRECGKVRRAAREPKTGGHALDAGTIPDEQTGMAGHELSAAERDAALREAFTRLPPCCQRLIAMLTQDPPVPYTQISDTLGIPVGSIGPNRSRCLDKLRRDPALAALINPDTASAGSEPSAQAPAL